VPLKDRKQYKTDTGRVVYGGGGITPDVFVKPAPLTTTTQLLEAKSALFNYGVEYASKHPELNKDLVITPQIVDDFARYAADKDVAPLADIRADLDKPTDRKFIERALKAEIVAAKYGFDASYPFRLQGDNQIEKAIEVFPEAQKLEVAALAARGNTNGNASDAGNRAAQAIPRSQ
jgi:carboxyl-terminal processing protease